MSGVRQTPHSTVMYTLQVECIVVHLPVECIVVHLPVECIVLLQVSGSRQSAGYYNVSARRNE